MIILRQIWVSIAPKWPKMASHCPNWPEIVKGSKKTMALFDHSGVAGLLSFCQEVRTGHKSNFGIVKREFNEWVGPNFYYCLYDSENNLRCIFGQFREGVFWEKSTFAYTHFSPKQTFLAPLNGCFWPNTWKIKCFQFIQCKVSQFGAQMWLLRNLQFWSHGPPQKPFGQ